MAEDEKLTQEVRTYMPDKYRLNIHPRYKGQKSASIWKNRCDIFKQFLETEDEFLRMQDRKVVHLRNDNFELMELFLMNNPEWGGIAINTCRVQEELEPEHVNMRCCVLRRKAVEEIKEERGKECNCNTVAKYLRPKWKWGYLKEGRIK